ncbi:MAG: hypothetical protein H6686_06840 [Fibrobacteria bacterium]|nr:hypothetical protein [Fibrobacteria bacterium]
MRTIRTLIAPLFLLCIAPLAEETPSYEEFSPEWFYSMGFVDAKASLSRRGLERFFQRDWDGATGLSVGSGVRVADQRLAQGAVELAKGADYLVDRNEDSAKISFLKCADLASSAAELAEDLPQHLRSTVLHARCLALLPDRGAAARVLAGSTRGMDDSADVAEFTYGAARLLEDMGRSDSADLLYRRAMQAEPRGPFALAALEGRIELGLQSNRPDSVMGLIRSAASLFPREKGLKIRLRIDEARCALLSGDTIRAEFLWKQMTNAFTLGRGEHLPDSLEAAEIYWRMGTLAAERAAQFTFLDSSLASRRQAHAQRRELMETAFGYYRQAVACYAFPWTPLALRDIAGVIERYAMDVASQRIDFKSDTDRVAQEVVVQKKLPGLFKSVAGTYRRQIRLAQATGDGMGIGLQSGRGLARAWWHSVLARRTAGELLATSPRPPADSLGAAWYESVIDSAVKAEQKAARKTAIDGLSDLSVLGQTAWPEVDSLRAVLGPEESRRIEAEGAEKASRQEVISPLQQDLPTTAIQWAWRGFEARRLARNTAIDIRILKARLAGL